MVEAVAELSSERKWGKRKEGRGKGKEWKEIRKMSRLGRKNLLEAHKLISFPLCWSLGPVHACPLLD